MNPRSDQALRSSPVGRGRTFDALARPYRLLERLALGGSLETARYHFLPRLRSCRRVLVLGDGDGRLVQRLLRLAPELCVDSLDKSEAMQALARAPQRGGACEGELSPGGCGGGGLCARDL